MLRQRQTLLGATPPACAYFEAFRALRANLAAAQAREPFSSLLVTSARPSDGKTVISANLGIVLALSRQKTVLVDADLRHPAVGALLDLPPGPGLVDVCNGKASVDDALVTTELEMLSVLPAGSPSSMAAELLESPDMRQVLSELSERFNIIIVDSPPVGAVSDATVLARILDRTVLVVRAGSRSPDPEARTLQNLASAGARILGIIVNDILPRDYAPYRQYYRYQYRYR